MYNVIVSDKELLDKLERDLNEIKIFLVGDMVTANTCEEEKENCLADTMRKNSKAIDRCVGLAVDIRDIIKGANK